MLPLPIKFKYFTLDRSYVQAVKEGDIPFQGYGLTDERGIIVASGTSLAGLIGHARGLDMQAEAEYQFATRHLPTLDHVKELDIDAPAERASGLLVPGAIVAPPDPNTRH